MKLQSVPGLGGWNLTGQFEVRHRGKRDQIGKPEAIHLRLLVAPEKSVIAFSQQAKSHEPSIERFVVGTPQSDPNYRRQPRIQLASVDLRPLSTPCHCHSAYAVIRDGMFRACRLLRETTRTGHSTHAPSTGPDLLLEICCCAPSESI